MVEHWDESESYEEAEFSLADLEKKPISRAKKLTLIVTAAIIVFVVLFLAFTAAGRDLVGNSSAILVKSFDEAFGLRASSGTIAEVALGSDGVDLNKASDSVEMTTTVAAAEFPPSLPLSSAKSSTRKSDVSVNKMAPSVPSAISMSVAEMNLLMGEPLAVGTKTASVVSSSAVMTSVFFPTTSSRSASVTLPLASSQTFVSLPGTVGLISVMFSGDGRGYVSSTPDGIVCDGGGTCAWNFPMGAKVTLRATHDTASMFSGWSGACSGTAPTCTLIVSGSMTTVASFKSKIAVVINVAAGEETAATTVSAVETSTTNSYATTFAASSDTVAAQSSTPASSTENSFTSVPAVAPALGHVVIAAVQIAGGASSNDFVKLYNPTSAAVDMGGWKLHKKSNTGTDYSLKTFAKGTVIPPGGLWVWANSANGFADFLGADVSSTQTLSVDNSVALFDNAGAMIDAIAWGNGAGQYGEGPPFPTSPGASQILTRKSVGGTFIDTDNNAEDFIVQ